MWLALDYVSPTVYYPCSKDINISEMGAFFKPANWLKIDMDLGHLSTPDLLQIDFGTNVDHPRWAQHLKVSHRLENLMDKNLTGKFTKNLVIPVRKRRQGRCEERRRQGDI